MRGPLSCSIVEAFPGSLAGLPELLGEWGIDCRRVAADAAGTALDQRRDDLVLVDNANPAATETMRRLLARRTLTAQPVVALCRKDSSLRLSQALALGCDDALAFPLDDAELHHRMRSLSALAVAEREQARRAVLLANYADPTTPSRRRATLSLMARPEILLVGPASEHQVRVANGIGPATVTYADEARAVARLLTERRFDLIWVVQGDADGRPLVPAASLTSELGGAAAIRILAGPIAAGAASFAASVAAGFDDVLPLPQPPEVVRLRTQFWLRLHTLRERLRAPVEGGAGQLAVDAMTGLFNQGFLADYAQARLADVQDDRPLSLLAVSLDGLADLSAAHGHSVVSRTTGLIGRRLARAVRPEDLSAHLGGGRFAVVLQGAPLAADAEIADRVSRHLRLLAERAVARKPSLSVGAAAVRVRRADELERTLARAFRSLVPSPRPSG